MIKREKTYLDAKSKADELAKCKWHSNVFDLVCEGGRDNIKKRLTLLEVWTSADKVYTMTIRFNKAGGWKLSRKKTPYADIFAYLVQNTEFVRKVNDLAEPIKEYCNNYNKE